MRTVLRLAFCLTLVSPAIHASITGKVAGTVRDAETGEALVGANILLGGTTLGSASDAGGYYVILNVPPGTYTLVASMIGYERYTVEGVRVDIDRTTTIALAMRSQVLGIGEVIVVAKRPVVAPDISNSQFSIRSEVIDQLPVVDVVEVIGLQAGIQVGSQGPLIRGSSSYQSQFLVDGFSMTDERANRPYTAMSLSAVQEIQVQSGGFTAEYGNVRSGVINLVTREGGRDGYSGGITTRYSPPAAKHFGPSIYAPNTYFTRPYLDPDVAWTGTDNGAWDTYTQRQYPRFGGFNAISEATLQDDDPTNDLSPAAVQRLYRWEHRRPGDIVGGDHTIDFGLGGPVPGLGRRLGNLRFFLAHRTEGVAFIFPLSRDSYRDNITQLKLTADAGPGMKISLLGLYGEIRSISPAEWTAPPNGVYLRTDYEVASRVTGSNANSVLYQPGYYNPLTIFRAVLGARFSHVLSDRTYYELSAQWMRNQYHAARTAPRDSTLTEIVPGYFVDEAPYGYYGFDRNSFTDGMSMGGWMGFAHDDSRNVTFAVKANFTSQVHPAHQLRAGFDLISNDFRIHSANLSPVRNTWTYALDWERRPYRLGVYLQDKIEIREFIANLGLRWDYADPNGDWYDLAAYDQALTDGRGNDIEELAPAAPAKPGMYLSPRLGVSHPITVDSKLYFNYGHFRQLVPGDFRFTIDRRGAGSVLRLGDPSLVQSKTVAYELGYERSLFDQVLLRVAAYYKDVSGQPSWTRYLSVDSRVDYSRAGTDNYEDIRGLELTLAKQRGGLLSGFVNYTYMVSTSGFFGVRNQFEDPIRQRDDLLLNRYQAKPRPRPYARASINVHLPDSFGPRFAGLRPLGGWNANLLARWQAGRSFTYNPGNLPGVQDNVQWRDTYGFDLRLSKNVAAKRFNLQFFVDISNLFNLKTFSDAGFSDSFDLDFYMASLHLPGEEGAEQGDDQPGDYRQAGEPFVPIETVDNPGMLGTPQARPIYYSREGEVFEDTNGNGMRDSGEAFEDLNGNGAYEGAGTYWRYQDGAWDLVDPDFLQHVLDTKSYIDMPNYTYFTFLNPRDITVGIRINF